MAEEPIMQRLRYAKTTYCGVLDYSRNILYNNDLGRNK